MLTNKEIMWGESWISLSMKMRDMPHYEYASTPKEEKDIITGTNDVLKSKFAKYVKTQPE